MIGEVMHSSGSKYSPMLDQRQMRLHSATCHNRQSPQRFHAVLQDPTLVHMPGSVHWYPLAELIALASPTFLVHIHMTGNMFTVEQLISAKLAGMLLKGLLGCARRAS